MIKCVLPHLRRSRYLCQRTRLPYEWHKTMSAPFLVFGVSRQILGEEAFLIKESPYQKRDHRGDRDKPPKRAKRQRRAENVQKRTRVHRMGKDSGRPGRKKPVNSGD